MFFMLPLAKLCLECTKKFFWARRVGDLEAKRWWHILPGADISSLTSPPFHLQPIPV